MHKKCALEKGCWVGQVAASLSSDRSLTETVNTFQGLTLVARGTTCSGWGLSPQSVHLIAT